MNLSEKNQKALDVLQSNYEEEMVRLQDSAIEWAVRGAITSGKLSQSDMDNLQAAIGSDDLDYDALQSAGFKF